mmetsp:Transcript_45342/g.97220  ORF Transcript_45342/g.97220 Transcript_45342/m.97220 type:complete len:248 (-) Transcript_45342:734-1477(-)
MVLGLGFHSFLGLCSCPFFTCRNFGFFNDAVCSSANMEALKHHSFFAFWKRCHLSTYQLFWRQLFLSLCRSPCFIGCLHLSEHLLQLLQLLGGDGGQQPLPIHRFALSIDLFDVLLRHFWGRWWHILLPFDKSILFQLNLLCEPFASLALFFFLVSGLSLSTVDGSKPLALGREAGLVGRQPGRNGVLQDVVEDVPVLCSLLHLDLDGFEQHVRHELVVAGQLHGIREDPCVEQVSQRLVHDAAEVS